LVLKRGTEECQLKFVLINLTVQAHLKQVLTLYFQEIPKAIKKLDEISIALIKALEERYS